jgi:hypothetical protein
LVLLDISSVLLVALISRINRDIALAALLVDIALAGFARIRRKIRGRFILVSSAGAFIAAAGWGDRRQILFRHCNPPVWQSLPGAKPGLGGLFCGLGGWCIGEAHWV